MEKNKRVVKGIGLFIGFVCLSGWFGKIIDMILVDQPKGQSLGSLIWLITPMIISIILVLFLHKENKYLGLRLHLKGNIVIYSVSLLLFPISAVVLLVVASCFNVIDLSNAPLSKVLSVFVTWFVYSFFRTILEEIAWQGYLVERLCRLKMKDWIIYVCVTLVWGTWHIPYYLFFYSNGDALMLIVSCYLNLACWSVLFTEVYRCTRSIWPCVLLHAASNAVQYLMLENYFVIDEKWNMILLPGTGVLSGVICLFAGVLIRRVRIRRTV